MDKKLIETEVYTANDKGVVFTKQLTRFGDEQTSINILLKKKEWLQLNKKSELICLAGKHESDYLNYISAF
mgnify:CR=1 FL=1